MGKRPRRFDHTGSQFTPVQPSTPRTATPRTATPRFADPESDRRWFADRDIDNDPETGADCYRSIRTMAQRTRRRPIRSPGRCASSMRRRKRAMHVDGPRRFLAIAFAVYGRVGNPYSPTLQRRVGRFVFRRTRQVGVANVGGRVRTLADRSGRHETFAIAIRRWFG